MTGEGWGPWLRLAYALEGCFDFVRVVSVFPSLDRVQRSATRTEQMRHAYPPAMQDKGGS